MEISELDLCNEIVKEMTKLEFNPISIEVVTNNDRFKDALNKHSILQKTQITMCLYNILMSSGINIPYQIRLGLNIAPTVESWLDDIKIVILPFLKINEDLFFPVKMN